MKKPTGRPGKNSDHTHRCIAIEFKSMEKMHAEMMGIEESKDGDHSDVVGDEGELGVVNTLHRSSPRNAERRSMMDLDDHRGKGAGFWSECSSLKSGNSSSDNSSNDSRYRKGERWGHANVRRDKVKKNCANNGGGQKT